jgi:transmembrane sensor
MTRENEEMTSIADQAAHWWVLFRDGEVSAAEKREFAEWVARAPEHVEASIRVAQVHAVLSRTGVRWPGTSAEDLIREAKAAPEENVFPLHRRASPSAQITRGPVMRVAIGLAASVVIAVLAGWFMLMQPERFQTKVGEQRSVMLADGSRVTLNTASKIEVRLRGDRRVIDLVQGQALFEVAHDAQRPFDVQAGNVVARALGTQFDVDRRAMRTVVTVVEGWVAIVGKPLPVLSAGDRAVIDGAGSSELEHGIDLTAAMAWTQRRLVFRHRPLGEIADELNRYTLGRIEIRSPALRAQEVTGTFRSDDVTSFIAVLEGIDGVRVTGDGAGGYIVTADEFAAPPR